MTYFNVVFRKVIHKNVRVGLCNGELMRGLAPSTLHTYLTPVRMRKVSRHMGVNLYLSKHPWSANYFRWCSCRPGRLLNYLPPPRPHRPDRHDDSSRRHQPPHLLRLGRGDLCLWIDLGARVEDLRSTLSLPLKTRVLVFRNPHPEGEQPVPLLHCDALSISVLNEAALRVKHHPITTLHDCRDAE